MRAQNLTISIPNKGCNKNCPYCVSRMTGDSDSKGPLMSRNVPKVIQLAKASQVTSVLLTGKGEPTLNMEDALLFASQFRAWPLEIQTNGIDLGLGKLRDLAINGMDIIAVSVDNVGDKHLPGLFTNIKETDMVSRATFNITNKMDLGTFQDLIELCKKWGVDQMTLRNVVIPNNTGDTKQAEWIRKHTNPKLYAKYRDDMIEACEKEGFLLRTLAHGAKVYDYQGIAVSYSDYCIQDNNSGEDIRSLIFMEDGHCYTSWNSKASILF